MSRIVFRPEAEADLTAIALHIAANSAARAHRVVTRLRSRCEILRQHPLAGRPRNELGEGLRSLSERPFVLIYRTMGDDVEIVAILHGARDLPAAIARRIDRDDP
ncbi:type II toxin-antitoxin system RelE/ParE family toxin [Terricaulis silvestris]|uniref:Toxin ParE3 n=1 Tax=Terricaulis silvestris TaxID=2686094 RepID=A0A6I6MSU6_9CAUL|nr:type II toxin-antitoxin system RelE/ParE family toxin [Terricaulis silvestris]QGZ96418.1 Toxin ParE3 [Terricaulis silvestris]